MSGQHYRLVFRNPDPNDETLVTTALTIGRIIPTKRTERGVRAFLARTDPAAFCRARSLPWTRFSEPLSIDDARAIVVRWMIRHGDQNLVCRGLVLVDTNRTVLFADPIDTASLSLHASS